VKTYVRALVMAGIGICCSTAAVAQDAEARIRALEEHNRRIEAQNAEILRRLSAAEERNRELETRLESAPGSEDRRLEELLTNLGDAARGNVVTNAALTRSASPIQFSGRIRLDSYYNTARMNRLVNPFWVVPEDGLSAEDNDDGFAFSARLTTLGIDVDGGKVGSADVGGRVQFDFANFTSDSIESREPVRLLIAYVNIDFGDVTLRFGQDWDVAAPYDPLIDEESHLWNSGNLGDRRPMAELLWRGGDPSGVAFEVNLAAGLTGAVDNDDLDVNQGQFLTTERDGFDFGLPNGQIEVAVSFNSWVSGERMRFGAFGLIGGLETDSEFGGKDDFTVWAAGFDFYLPLLTDVALKGEAFMGQSLADFRGGIGQSIDFLTGDEIESIGGFAEVYWQTTELFGFGLGGALDNPDFDDLGDGARASNWTVYLATRFDWGGGLRSGFDVMFWKTQYVGREEGDTLRFNAYVELNF
jgi:hypothetical protein